MNIIEMDETRATEILEENGILLEGAAPGELGPSYGHYVSWRPGAAKIVLDAVVGAEQRCRCPMRILGPMMVAVLFAMVADAGAQTVGFIPAKDGPVFCKYEAAARKFETPAPLSDFALPVYLKAPARDFYVAGDLFVNGIGKIEDSEASRQWAIELLAKEAKERGASAVWLVTPFAGRYCQVVVLKWER